MSIDKIIVIIAGALGILITYWFFLGGKRRKMPMNMEDHMHHE